MNIIVLSLLILSYSLVLGIIFAQVLLTAPVVFKVLDDESASKFLRKIFPRYYLLILLISLISSLISFLWFEQIDLYMALSISILAFIGYTGRRPLCETPWHQLLRPPHQPTTTTLSDRDYPVLLTFRLMQRNGRLYCGRRATHLSMDCQLFG